MEKFKKVDYEFKGIKGTVLIGESIVNKQEIKNICMKDYLEKLSNEIKLVGEEE